MTEPLTPADLDAYRQTIRRWGNLYAADATRLLDELERTRGALRECISLLVEGYMAVCADDTESANRTVAFLMGVDAGTIARARAVLPPEEPKP